MQHRYMAAVFAVWASLALVAFGCGGDDDEGGGSSGSGDSNALVQPPEDIEPLQEIGEGEGEVNLKIGNTSDEMVTLMRTGNYDGVSASGDATLRLIAGGDVAPVNTDLVPNYKDVFDALKQKPHNSVEGQMYGIPHGRGANLLMWNKGKVKPAPDSWGVVFDPSSKYKGKVTAYDSPIYIADAALYLKATKPELGIENPYELDDKQFKASIDLLKQQHGIVGEYWSDYAKEQSAFNNGDSVLGTTWQITANYIEADGKVKI